MLCQFGRRFIIYCGALMTVEESKQCNNCSLFRACSQLARHQSDGWSVQQLSVVPAAVCHNYSCQSPVSTTVSHHSSHFIVILTWTISNCSRPPNTLGLQIKINLLNVDVQYGLLKQAIGFMITAALIFKTFH